MECFSIKEQTLHNEIVDAVFFITTFCFVQDVQQAMNEAYRVLKPGGCIVIGLLPLDSALGQATKAHAGNDLFFKDAKLRTKAEILGALASGGFALHHSSQTLIGAPRDFETSPPCQQAGHDQGSFVVFQAVKPLTSPPA